MSSNEMFSQNMKKLRSQKNISQAELSRHLGVSQQTVGKWESGITVPRQPMLIKICNFFQVSTDYILNHSDATEPAPAATKPPAPARTQRDQAMLDKYHTLTPSHRDAVDSVIDTFYLQDKPKTEDTGM